MVLQVPFMMQRHQLICLASLSKTRTIATTLNVLQGLLWQSLGATSPTPICLYFAQQDSNTVHHRHLLELMQKLKVRCTVQVCALATAKSISVACAAC